MNTTDKTPVIGTRIPRWTSAYYAGWMQGANNDGYLKAEKIDYSAVTAVIHFSVIPRTDGTSVQKKIDYVSQNGLGGVIIWELAGGWRPQNIVPDYLLKAVKKATRWMPI